MRYQTHGDNRSKKEKKKKEKKGMTRIIHESKKEALGRGLLPFADLKVLCLEIQGFDTVGNHAAIRL